MAPARVYSISPYFTYYVILRLLFYHFYNLSSFYPLVSFFSFSLSVFLFPSFILSSIFALSILYRFFFSVFPYMLWYSLFLPSILMSFFKLLFFIFSFYHLFLCNSLFLSFYQFCPTIPYVFFVFSIFNLLFYPSIIYSLSFFSYPVLCYSLFLPSFSFFYDIVCFYYFRLFLLSPSLM